MKILSTLVVLLALLHSGLAYSANTPPAGTTGSPQINNSGQIYGAPLPSAPLSSSSPNITLPPKAYTAISSGLEVDPRAYGAKCTGGYGINPISAGISSAGTHWAQNDTFLISDQTIGGRMRGGVLASGHVTTVNGSGGVTGFVIDNPGSGYAPSGAIWAQPTGNSLGVGFAVGWGSIYSFPAIPSTTLASGGNAFGTGVGGSYADGGAYSIGDTFAVVNPALDGNYMTGVVTSVLAGKVTGYTILNPGGDYQVLNNVSTVTLTGYGSGLTINVTSGTAANHTWDDTYGLSVGAQVSNALGGFLRMPDNCWGANWNVPDGTTVLGQNFVPNYGYGDVPSLIYPSRGPHYFIIGTPRYGIDYGAGGFAGNISLMGFEVRGYTGYQFGASTTWDSTACIGTSSGTNNLANVYTLNMSGKGCFVGLGSYNGAGSLIYAKDISSDWGANQNGIYGPFSDFVTINATIPSTNVGIWLSSSAGGLARIIAPRTEYQGDVGIRLDAGGGQAQIIGWQHDRSGNCALQVTNATEVTLTGSVLKGAGLAGTLSVTGSASGTAGVVRLTVSGFGKSPTGGATPTSGLLNGDKANVSGIVGTTEANGNQFTITVVDGTHIELNGTVWANAWISGGKVSINGKGAYICLSGTTDFHADNTGFYGYSAGALLAAANVIDATSSTNISLTGGSANFSNSGSGLFGGYQQAFGNWHNAGNTPPASTVYDVMGTPPFRNDFAQVGVGFITGGTKFTTSGCSISATAGGATGGTFTLGANSCTAVVTFNGATGLGTSAPTTGWNCTATDRTAPTVLIGGNSSSTTTTASFTIPAGAGATDVIGFSCQGY